jgi:hypothetical protein
MTAIASTHDDLADPLSAVETRASKISAKKKTKKFKGKSDMEMKKIRKNNAMSRGHTKTKQNKTNINQSINTIYTYLPFPRQRPQGLV